mmetsp:Transcript_40836/g.121914  ORF Transcript_40836/g.121914 Transcript_40836/m.121914 type:complete len:160 (-) Transcript_40836:1011-1490(-)
MALVALSAVEALRSVRPVIAAAAAAIAADLRSQGRIPAPCIPQPVVPPASASWWPGLRCASSSTKPDFQAAALRNAGVQAIGGPRPAASPPREPGPEECCQKGCRTCVWDLYTAELRAWQLQNPGAKAASGDEDSAGARAAVAVDAFLETERRLEKRKQ